tara:strand:+ start:3754 stop:4917 length:1164 start_codon:yes stop_codon:yes gene_type:complete
VNKAIYISAMPFSEKVSRDWYISLLRENNYDIEFWDVSDISNSNKNIISSTRDKIQVLSNFSYPKFEEMLIRNNHIKIIYIVVVSFHKKTSKIYTTLKKINPYTVFFNWGETPEGGISFKKKTFSQKLMMYKNNQLPFLSSLSSLTGILYCKILKYLNKIKIHDIYFNAGGYTNTPKNAKRVVNINLCDYDQYISQKANDNKVDNFTVFIDSNLVSNSDIELNGLKKIDQDKYLSSLNHFFDMFEKQYKTRVIISAHPTSNYSQNDFNGREILKLKSAELISNSKYVLSHHSTAVSYAVLNYKPIIFLTIDDWIGEYEEYANSEFSKSLQASLINIDSIKFEDNILIKDVDISIYDKYKYNFIVSKDVEGIESSKIILKEFNEYFVN